MESEKTMTSKINRAFELIALDACSLLRKWSDEGASVGPPKIAEFRQQLIQVLAETYFGTHPRLSDYEH